MAGICQRWGKAYNEGGRESGKGRWRMKGMNESQKKSIRVVDSLPLPSEDKLRTLSEILVRQVEQEKRRNRYASVKQVLAFLGTGAVVGLSLFVAPTAVMLAKPFLDAKREKEREEWKQFNPSYLKRTLARMRREKLVKIVERDGEQIIELTKNGRRRIIKYSLENLSIDKSNAWDGRWRLVMYDVPHRRKQLRDVFRETLKNLGFYQLQESVWVFPYPCEDQVSFLREFYGVGNEVLYVVATKLEDDAPYRTYFGLDA